MSDFTTHSATLSVDLAAIRHNWRLLDGLSAPDCHTGATIKANAYGLGMMPVSLALYQEGCRDFYAARLGEAITLYEGFAAKHITDARIIVFDGIAKGQEEAFIRYPLIAVLNDEAQLARAKTIAAQINKPLPVIIHIDTAMARLGFAPTKWQALQADDGWDEGLDIIMLMSHLASADDPASPQNSKQLEIFTALTENTPWARSLANSGGVLMDAPYHFDAVRPGLALYGLSPSYPIEGLRNTFTLSTDILQIRDIVAGESVGYGASFIAPHAMRLATLGIGYADGLLRHYKDHLSVRIAGYHCPLVGRISMDSCVADISAIPRTELETLSTAILLDSTFSAADLAEKTGTISYEIMTILGERLLRLYDEAVS